MMLSRRVLVLMVAASVGSGTVASVGVGGEEGFNCCVQPFSFFDCTGSGHEVSPGKLYNCVQTADLAGCMTCLSTVDYSNGTCSACCSVLSDAKCIGLESDWEFYASTLFFVCLCCCFTALCGYTEVRRKKKGISFAEAWSVPQAIPILRTWPGRSLSSSDMMPGQGAEDQHWGQLSDSEEDLKKYPVAGLVDDSGLTFGFVASMPQSLLNSLAPPRRHPDTTRDAPPGSQMEPELTIRIPGARGSGAAVVEAGDDVETAVVTRAEGHSGVDEAGRLTRGGGQAAAGAAVGNDLQEPLMFGDGTAPSRRDAGVEGGGSARGGVVR